MYQYFFNNPVHLFLLKQVADTHTPYTNGDTPLFIYSFLNQ
jgi:hypothetical protein